MSCVGTTPTPSSRARFGTAVVVQPVVVGAAERRRVGLFFHRRQIKSGRREEQAALDAVAVHGFEALLRISCQMAILIHRRAVLLDAKRRLVRPAVMAVALDSK
jgi:hypothetical protein